MAFTSATGIENGFHLILDVARELNGDVESILTSPDFRRLIVRRGEESVVIDLIHEYVFQTSPQKRLINKIRVDTEEEIFANKLCALLSRSEIRDLVDVRQLENAGFSLEDALNAAKKKDSGLTAAQLAWVLGQIRIDEKSSLPGGIDSSEMNIYLSDLVDRLRRAAAPSH